MRENAYQRKQAFLEHYREHFSIRAAARHAGISHVRVYAWAEHDPQFKKDFEAARQAAIDHLEATAFRLATEGQAITRMNSQGDTVVDHVISEKMLEMMLKGYRRDIYGDQRKLELTGAGGAALEIKPEVHFNLVRLAAEVLSGANLLGAPEGGSEPLDPESPDPGES